MQTLTVGQLNALRRESDINVINVLGHQAYEEAHIPGSINIPGDSDDFVEQVTDAVGSEDAPVVVYCASTECQASPKAARRLEAAGFSHVYDFEGGVRGWKAAGQPLEHGA